MINNIIYFSIKNKLIVGLMTVSLICAGVYSMFTMNLGSLPDITNNQVQVITVSQSLATEDIERFVTFPVELAMANLPGVVEIRSISRFGLSVVTIVFEDDMGTYLPRQLVQEKLNTVKQQIPEQFGNPHMGPITTGLGEIYQYTLQPKPGYEADFSPTELRTIQDWIVKRQMALVDGVVGINSFGGKIKQYEIAINPERLNANNISISEVFEALRHNNANTGGAYIEKHNMANFIRGEGLVRSLEDIQNIFIKNENGIPVLIRDIAEKVHFGHQIRYGAFTQDGREAVGGIIMMLRGSNSNAVIHNVQERIGEIQKSLPEGIEIKPFLDRSALIERTTTTVTQNLTEGALIVIFVLVILLGSIRGGIITASAIPLSLLFAFIMMRLFDVSGNLISLGAIDFGIIVDGVVIIVERTVFEIQKQLRSNTFAISQDVMDDIAYNAGSTMMKTAFFGQLIILIVFIPILSLTGIEGKMFHPMAYTLGFAMLGAILLCLTYVPMMSALLLKPTKNKGALYKKLGKRLENCGNRIVSGFHHAYRPILKSALRHKAIVIIVAISLFGSAGFIFSRMGGVFIPQLDEGDIAMQALIRPGSSLSEAIEVSNKIENILLENFPEIQSVLSKIGVSDIPTDPMPMDIADMFIILEKDTSQWVSANSKDALIEKIKTLLDSRLVGVNLVFSQPVELRFNELLTGVREDIAVKLYGDDLSVLAQKVEQMAKIIQTVPGVGDVSPERITGLPQMTVRYNREKLAQYELNIEKLNEYINTAFAGGVAGIILEGEKRFEMVIRFDPAYQKSIDDLRNLYVDLPNGHQIPLQELADINYAQGPMQISRDNAYRRTYVGINTRGRDVESVVRDIQQKLNTELDLPPGYYLTYGGEYENLLSAKQRLTVLVPIVLFMVFLLLYFALRSISHSLIIFAGVPLAAIGGVFALWIRDMPFSISAGIGFIVVFGIAVLDDLVLIDRFNTLKAEGFTHIKQRILIGTKERIRPILLADTTDIVGFMPMALAVTAGSEIQHPLSTVVIGGLFSSALFTLIVLPVLYAIVEIHGTETPKGAEKKRREKTLISKPRKPMSILLLLFVSLYAATATPAPTHPSGSEQTIALDDAKRLAIENFPKIQAAKLEIENQEVLKKTAWNLGNTSIFTGGEEIGKAQGVYTQIGIQQRQIDIFGVSPRLKLQEEQIGLAESVFRLSVIEVEREVSRAWAEAYTAQKNYRVYTRLDSIFKDIERAASIRLEVGATSKLEYLATANQGNQVQILKEQAYRDYLSALQKLNLWFVTDTFFNVPDTPAHQLDIPLESTAGALENHPLLDVSKQQINVADAAVNERKAQFMPKFNLMYGKQEITGLPGGFHQFQAGIQIPLFFGPELGRSQSAKIQRSIAAQNLRQTQRELNTAYQSIREQYTKWLNSWRYYQQTALPMAQEQQEGALFAYKKGAIDYVTFLQNMREAIRVEIDSWSAFGNYLDSRFQLEYFLKKPH
ncbi:CusA/CzcA family heavy metal efflux RND transporter [Nitrosomonas marina]|uniref:Cobalt-zinc-cadmium resistance protein CzcA n=1 Tax=Nitrosomonas marina TaxID=917 RepID=A0A1H8GCI8_9PROT|nr:CusA/CzcA family heavy metal efflux RND transporter [Nitrosomonas marina]SEN41549.1 cobalt-zinc-cadmium resistance protein CzcA [Nitrosomonas marina]